MEGLGQQGGCETIHDDLFVRALWLSEGAENILILGCDLLFFERQDIDRFKGALGRCVGLPPVRILLNTSHSHAGPRLTRWAYSDGPDPLYIEQVEAAFIVTARAALAARVEVTVWAGMGQTDVPVSRRKPDSDGQAQWAPYLAGEVCNALPCCLFKDGNGDVVSLLFSASCHPSIIYSLDVSAEYPGAATRRLNAHFGTEGALFLQGSGGDSKPRAIAVGEQYWRHGTFEDVENTGQAVADAVIATAEQGLTEITPDLHAELVEIDFPFQPVPPRSSFEQAPTGPDKPAGRSRWAADMLARLDRFGVLPDSIGILLHAVQIGQGCRLVALEGEVVGELGNLIIEHCGDGITFPLGYTNGCRIYLPSSRMMAGHGYEVDSSWEYHHPAPLAPQTDEVVMAALDAIGA